MERQNRVPLTELPVVLRECELPDVLRVAAELYARDRAYLDRLTQVQELARAAVEAGLPLEYLERAAGTLQAERITRRRRRLRRRGLLAAAAAALVLFTGRGLFIESAGPPPEAYVSYPGGPYGGPPPGYGPYGPPGAAPAYVAPESPGPGAEAPVPAGPLSGYSPPPGYGPPVGYGTMPSPAGPGGYPGPPGGPPGYGPAR